MKDMANAIKLALAALCLLQLYIPVQSQVSKIPDAVNDKSGALAAVSDLSNISLAEPKIESVPSGRLPLSIRPFHYTLWLQPFINGNRSINGQISIDLEVVSETDRIVMNMVDIITYNNTVELMAYEGTTSLPKVLRQTYNPDLQFYSIILDSTLKKGQKYKLSLSFEGYLNSKLVGFYFSSYKDESGNQRNLASTQFSPTDARRAFPCFDEPGFKATFDISLIREKNMTSLSNVPLISSQRVSTTEDWLIDHFKTTPKMSTYHVGFLISDFVDKPSNYLNHTEFRVWSRKAAIDQTAYALEVGPKILQELESYFGIKFPLPKLDMAAITNFKFNGMENWGLIMYRESAMLFDPLVSTVDSKRGIMRVIAHEVAHMWFGNLVTPEWWSELWLKEGFANFMGFKAADVVEPSWKMIDYLVDSSYYSAFSLDSLKSSHPINVVVDRTDRISEIFDDISYNKGAAIIRMMQHFLTEPVFKKGMTSYLETLKFSNAVQDDLWGFLTNAWKHSNLYNPDITVKLVMDTWTLQEGFPVLTVSRNEANLSVKQMRFLMDGDAVESNLLSNESRWWIPVSYTTESASDFESTEPKVWMSPMDHEIQIPDDVPSNEWIILNVQKTGFFRVNYANETWTMLRNQLMKNFSVIHHLNRAQLLDDSFSLARAGLIDYSIPLSLVKYIKTERDGTAWSTFLKNFGYMYSMAQFTPELPLFQKYLLDLVIPLYNETGFTDNSEDEYDIQILRIMATAWACKIKHQPCLDKATKLFNQWLTLPRNESSALISNNVKPTVLCEGIRQSSFESWNKTFQAYLSSNVQTEKADILRALGCSTNSSTLQRYLEMSLDPASGIIKQDTTIIFGSVSKSKEGRDLAWKVVKEKWNFIFEYFGSGSNALGRILESPAKKLNTKEFVEDLKAFGEVNKDNMGSAQQSLKLSLETSELNVKWMENRLPQIIKILQN